MPSKPPSSSKPSLERTWNIVGAQQEEPGRAASAEQNGQVERSISDDLTADLPDDLQAVAQQLTDDALYLAARYPAAATAPTAWVQSHLPASRPWPMWQKAVAAVALIAFGSAATEIATHWRPPSETPAVNALSDSDASFHEKLSSPTLGSGTVDGGIVGDGSNSFGVQAVGFNTAQPARTALSEVEMLRIQSAAFEQVIRKLQDELARRDKQQTDMQQTLESLRQEVSELRQRVNEPQRADKDK